MKRMFVPDQSNIPASADAVVIGGGIVGTATAFWLSHAGLDTVLVEMREGLSTLTTPNSVECFRAQFTEPAMAELAVGSIEVFNNFAEVIGITGYDISLHHRGYLFITDDDSKEADLRASVQQHHRLGVQDSEYLTGEEVLARFPYVSENVIGGSFRQSDGWLSSHEVTQGFAKGCSAQFLLETKATGIQRDQAGVCAVETTRGSIHTRLVVNAAGPFAGVIGSMVDLDLPLEPVRRQKAFVTDRNGIIPQDAAMTIDLSRDAYWRPEVGGAYIGWVDPDEPVSAPSEDLTTDWDFPAKTIDLLTHLSPFWEEVAADLRATDVQVSAGQYVYTPDDQPLIGPIPEVPGFYVNCGYWAGVMLSPMAGKRIADLVTGELDPNDNPLRPTRYEEGLQLESGSFLRGRH